MKIGIEINIYFYSNGSININIINLIKYLLLINLIYIFLNKNKKKNNI